MERMKEICPNAHFINCLAHCLNLAVSDANKTVPLMQNALDIFVHHLVTFVHNSYKRTDIYHCTQQLESTMAEDLDLEHGNNARINLCISFRPLCPTRWTIRTSAINNMFVIMNT